MKVGYSPDYVSLPGCYTTPATPRQMSMDIGKCRSRPYSPDHVSLLQHIMSTNRCLGRSYSQYIQQHYMTSAEQLIHAIYLPR